MSVLDDFIKVREQVVNEIKRIFDVAGIRYYSVIDFRLITYHLIEIEYVKSIIDTEKNFLVIYKGLFEMNNEDIKKFFNVDWAKLKNCYDEYIKIFDYRGI